jgi:cytochrome c oxidase cbb3-type subunit 2
MEFFNNHKNLFISAAALFIALTIFVAIMPAIDNQVRNAPLPNAEPMSEAAKKGKALYIANGCVACHTQQVRNIDMDKMWGSRPSIAADYANIKRQDVWRNTATLMGTERTGPDLTDVGNRQPSLEWNLLHLYNPRAVVKASIMPAYTWLFEYKKNPGPNDVVVAVPPNFLKNKNAKVVAKEEALQLVAYLQSLKQTELPTGIPTPEFLYKRAQKVLAGEAADGGVIAADGVALYATHCQACHQENGEGLPGAFPPLKGSKIVLDDNSQTMVDIIMNGYNGRASEGYGPMAAVGTLAGLTAAEVSAIMNHEKTSWGNDAKKITPEEVQKIIDSLK